MNSKKERKIVNIIIIISLSLSLGFIALAILFLGLRDNSQIIKVNPDTGREAITITSGALITPIAPGEVHQDCRFLGGTWLEVASEYQECENATEAYCAGYGGKFNICASPCRHNPEAEACTMNCVAVCSF
ncbi:MAG: hypothetical protein WCJ58_05880 [bacterium]